MRVGTVVYMTTIEETTMGPQTLTYREAIDVLDRHQVVALAVACAELALPVWLAHHPHDDRPSAAIRAAREWLACPCEAHDAALGAAAEHAAYAAARALGDARPVWRVVLEHTTDLTGAELDIAAVLADEGWHGTVDALVEAARLLEVAA